MADRDDLRCKIDADFERWPAPSVFIRPSDGRWTPKAVGEALKQGEPPIHLEDEFGDLMVSTLCLQPGEEQLVVAGLRRVLDEVGR